MFFFFYNKIPAAYSNVVTQTSKKAIKEIGFENWVVNTAPYKKLISSLPQILPAEDKNCSEKVAYYFDNITLENDGLDKKNIDECANVFFDVMSSHNKKRYRLDFLINKTLFNCIYVTDLYILGDSTADIIKIYEQCIKKDKVICVIDNSKENRVSEYSLCSIEGNAYPKKEQIRIVDQLALLDEKEHKNNKNKSAILKGGSGGDKIMLSKDFWVAYYLFEITMEIPQDIAISISGISKSSFVARCLEVETCYDQMMFRIETQFLTYEEMLKRTFNAKNLTPEQFYDMPKRLGALPSSDTMSFSSLREKMTIIEQDVKNTDELQLELNRICLSNGIPKMLYFNYKRYCTKQDNPSKKTLSKFYNYDKSKIDLYELSKNSLLKAAALVGQKNVDTRKLCKGILIAMYDFDI